MFDSKKYYTENKKEISHKTKDYQKTEKAQKLRRENRKKHKMEQCEKDKISGKIRRAKRKKYIDDYKLSKGCSICGYNKCAEALDFHHEGNKDFDISRAIGSQNISLEKIMEEIKKCIILCATCHRELHSKE